MNKEEEAQKIIDRLTGIDYTYFRFKNSQPTGTVVTITKTGPNTWVMLGDTSGMDII